MSDTNWSAEGIRQASKEGNINAYGEYTVRQWFSIGEGEPYKENFVDAGCGRGLTIMSLGLAGEAGEVLEKIKKIIRDGSFDPDALKKELGDVGFYWARLCRYFGWSPSEVIGANIDKLDDRLARGTHRGSGDNR